MNWLKLRAVGCAAGVMLSMFVPIHIADANAMFSTSLSTGRNDFVGATFSPSVAPTISATDVGNVTRLSWPIVTISSGAQVRYIVMRYLNGVGTAVCTAVGAITFTTTTAQCSDNTALRATPYSYTEQPFVSVGGVTTWTLAPSAPGDAVCLKVKKC